MPRKPLIECLRRGAHLLDLQQADLAYTAREPYAVVDGMAIVDVSGILASDAGFWDGWGVSDYGRIQSEILGAVASGNVDGILLRVNSPGGETDMAFEVAATIAEAAKSKPVWAVADVSAYSAGYLLASSAQQLYAAPSSGGIGSIGVYALHLDYSGYLEQAGIQPTIIKAGDGKADGNPYEPLSRSARADMQAEVDRLYEMFVGWVSARRGISEKVIREKLGARTYHGGDNVVSLGLADGVGTLESVMQEFRSFLGGRNKPKKASTTAASAAIKQEGSTMANHDPSAVASPVASEETAPVATAAAAQPPAAPQPAARTTEANHSEAVEIASLCVIAGKDARFILNALKQRKTAAALREELADAAAGNGSTEIAGHTRPHTASEDHLVSGDKKQDSAALLAAVAKLGKGA